MNLWRSNSPEVQKKYFCNIKLVSFRIILSSFYKNVSATSVVVFLKILDLDLKYIFVLLRLSLKLLAELVNINIYLLAISEFCRY